MDDEDRQRSSMELAATTASDPSDIVSSFEASSSPSKSVPPKQDSENPGSEEGPYRRESSFARRRSTEGPMLPRQSFLSRRRAGSILRNDEGRSSFVSDPTVLSFRLSFQDGHHQPATEDHVADSGDGIDGTFTTGTSADGEKKQWTKSPMNDKYTYREHIFVVFLGMILSFNSGFSNGICLSGFLASSSAIWQRQSTSGYTGAYTNIGLAMADTQGEIDALDQEGFVAFQLCMILAFMGGSCISGLLNPKPSPWRLGPMYIPTLLIGTLFMVIAATVSSYNGKSRFLFYYVAAANGVQNGVSSMYTGNLIRTTHMTGTSTDIGLFCGQLLRGNTKNAWKLQILIGLAVAFWFGGFLSFYAAQSFTRYALLISAAIFLVITLVAIFFLVVNLHVPIRHSILGAWHWKKVMQQLDFDAHSLRDAFNKMDSKGEGSIDKEDFYEGFVAAGLDPSVPKTTVDLLFDVADVNGDGRIEFEEFEALVSGQHVILG